MLPRQKHKKLGSYGGGGGGGGESVPPGSEEPPKGPVLIGLTLQGLGGGVKRYKICNNFLITCSFALKFYDLS